MAQGVGGYLVVAVVVAIGVGVCWWRMVPRAEPGTPDDDGRGVWIPAGSAIVGLTWPAWVAYAVIVALVAGLVEGRIWWWRRRHVRRRAVAGRG